MITGRRSSSNAIVVDRTLVHMGQESLFKSSCDSDVDNYLIVYIIRACDDFLPFFRLSRRSSFLHSLRDQLTQVVSYILLGLTLQLFKISSILDPL